MSAVRLFRCSFAVLLASGLGRSAQADRPVFIEPLQPAIQRIASNLHAVPNERRQILDDAAQHIAAGILSGTSANLVFICTHNSRRSQLGQVWAEIAAAYYDVPGVATFSGGTAATACNPRTVAALRRAGFSVVQSSLGENPRYLVQYAEGRPAISLFSKRFDSEGNPTQGFVAMMCCSDADEDCPLIPGATARAPLHYDDPKSADGTPEETARYDERSRQIAAEMFYLMSAVADRLRG